MLTAGIVMMMVRMTSMTVVVIMIWLRTCMMIFPALTMITQSRWCTGVAAALRAAGRWSVRAAAMKARPFTHNNLAPMRTISA